MESRFVVSDKDVLSAINHAIACNEGDDATINVLICVGADIFGIDEEEFEGILSKYQVNT